MNPFRFPITSLFSGGAFLPFEPLNLILEASENNGALYLGNYEAASDVVLLRKHGIKAVLTVAADLRLNYPSNEGIIHEVIPALDMVSYDLSRHFSRCLEFIEKTRKETNVLVHCLAGISRSATIVIAYLMKLNKIGFDQSFNFVKKRRKIIFPNPGFVRQLRVYSSQMKVKGFGDTNRARSKAKLVDDNSANLRSLSLNNVTAQKKINQEPINFKTPQKSYNYYNVNFSSNTKEKAYYGVKPINNTPQMKKPVNNSFVKNPYTQSLTKSNKKDMGKSSEKLNSNFFTPSPAKNQSTKAKENENFMFLKSRKI